MLERWKTPMSTFPEPGRMGEAGSLPNPGAGELGEREVREQGERDLFRCQAASPANKHPKRS